MFFPLKKKGRRVSAAFTGVSGCRVVCVCHEVMVTSATKAESEMEFPSAEKVNT